MGRDKEVDRRWHDDINQQWQGTTWSRKPRDRQQWRELDEATSNSGETQPRYKVQGLNIY